LQTRKTIKLDPERSNKAIMWTTTGSTKFATFLSEATNIGIQNMCLATEISNQEEIQPHAFTEPPQINITSIEHAQSAQHTFDISLE
jgi:predicted transcriptional regulator